MGASLKNGSSKSCGCLRFFDLTGRVFERWTVLEFAGRTKSRSFLWKCQCSCKDKKIGFVTTSSLMSGSSKSCGCYGKERREESLSLPIGQAAFNRLFRSYKNGAQKRNLDFSLTKNEARKLFEENCYYCGVEPQTSVNEGCSDRNFNGDFIYNCIDRIDNSKGYIFLQSPQNHVLWCQSSTDRRRYEYSQQGLQRNAQKPLVVQLWRKQSISFRRQADSGL